MGKKLAKGPAQPACQSPFSWKLGPGCCRPGGNSTDSQHSLGPRTRATLSVPGHGGSGSVFLQLLSLLPSGKAHGATTLSSSRPPAPSSTNPTVAFFLPSWSHPPSSAPPGPLPLLPRSGGHLGCSSGGLGQRPHCHPPLHHLSLLSNVTTGYSAPGPWLSSHLFASKPSRRPPAPCLRLSDHGAPVPPAFAHHSSRL